MRRQSGGGAGSASSSSANRSVAAGRPTRSEHRALMYSRGVSGNIMDRFPASSSTSARLLPSSSLSSTSTTTGSAPTSSPTTSTLGARARFLITREAGAGRTRRASLSTTGVEGVASLVGVVGAPPSRPGCT